MSDTSSPEDLLQLCLWDLVAAGRLVASRLPVLLDHVDDLVLCREFDQVVAEFDMRADRLSTLAIREEGPCNLWMAGMLDDAERDTRTIDRGRKLDIAMIGAVRKMLHAEAASIETAMALGERLLEYEAAKSVSDCHSECLERDAILRALLQKLAESWAERLADHSGITAYTY